MNKLSVDNMTSAYHWYERLAMRRDWFCTVGINDWWKPIPKKNWTAKICSVPLGLWEFPEKRWLNDHFSSNFEGFLIVIGSFFWAPTGFPTQIKSVAFFSHWHLWLSQKISFPFARIRIGDLCQRWFLRHITSIRIDTKTAEGLGMWSSPFFLVVALGSVGRGWMEIDLFLSLKEVGWKKVDLQGNVQKILCLY